MNFFVGEPENLKFQHHVPSKKKAKKEKKSCILKTKKADGRLLDCYDFAYTDRDVVNQVAKVAVGAIKGATNDINNMAKQRIDLIIPQGGNKIERVLPKILRRAIEDVYETPFRLLGNFGKQQLNKLKRKILN